MILIIHYILSIKCCRHVIDLINITLNYGYKFDLSIDGLEAKLRLLNRIKRLRASLNKLFQVKCLHFTIKSQSIPEMLVVPRATYKV